MFYNFLIQPPYIYSTQEYKRTWESAKTRFLKTIIRDIDSEEYGLDEEVIKCFRAKCRTWRDRYEDEK